MKFVVRRRIAEMSILSFCKIMGWGTWHVIAQAHHLRPIFHAIFP